MKSSSQVTFAVVWQQHWHKSHLHHVLWDSVCVYIHICVLMGDLLKIFEYLCLYYIFSCIQYFESSSNHPHACLFIINRH